MDWLFWIVAGLLAALAAALVAMRAAAAARTADGAEDPALGVYRRQLAELDDLAARGLLGEEEHRAAFAEAGRRLLGESEKTAVPEIVGGRGPQRLVLAAMAAAGIGALALYFILGSPGLGDRPYRLRLAEWRAGDPSRLKPAEMAAVLRSVVADRPNDPQAVEFLGRTELAAGDAVAAAQAFRKAVAMTPGRADLHLLLGEALTAQAEDGVPSAQALAEFRRALELDPANLAARYVLARNEAVAGNRDAGLAALRGIEAGLAPGDPRRSILTADIAKLSGAPVPQAPAAVPQGADQAAFIQGMVARLAARLETTPDDPEGWARLVRAYGVLGDDAAKAKALARARELFAKRPADLAKVEAEARPSPP